MDGGLNELYFTNTEKNDSILDISVQIPYSTSKDRLSVYRKFSGAPFFVFTKLSVNYQNEERNLKMSSYRITSLQKTFNVLTFITLNMSLQRFFGHVLCLASLGYLHPQN